MKEHVRYSRARNQLYSVKVAFRELKEKPSFKKPTPQLTQLLDMLESIIDTACNSFERGHILEVLVNEYVPTALPGFEDMMGEDREAVRMDRPFPSASEGYDPDKRPDEDWREHIRNKYYGDDPSE